MLISIPRAWDFRWNLSKFNELFPQQYNKRPVAGIAVKQR